MSSNEELLCDSADIRRGALLGGGTFGQVYRSEHSSFGLVAERVVPSLPAEQEENVRESMKPLYRLRCDNASRLYGLVLQPDNCSLLTEYAQFGPVEELIKVKPPWAVRAKVMREVAMGLKYLHAHHVMHGNLSRHNVVISNDLVAKVTDFGLSEWRGLASNRQGGDTGDIAGKPLVCTGPYDPPEAFTKSASESLTCSFDIYSYGILSWEVITSEQAWKGQFLLGSV
ncbi:receptor-interacting serine/threonine-protein kinase 2-like [Branchiostoma floridae x Branchiostoma belcheri]